MALNDITKHNKQNAQDAADTLVNLLDSFTDEQWNARRELVMELVEFYSRTAVTVTEKYGAAAEVITTMMTPDSTDSEKRESIQQFNDILSGRFVTEVTRHREKPERLTTGGIDTSNSATEGYMRGAPIPEPKFNLGSESTTTTDENPDTPQGLRKRG